MKKLAVFGVACAMTIGLTPRLRADDDRLASAEAVLTDMAGAPDSGIPQDLLKRSRCIVIIPSVKKAALGVGGQYGRGYLACRSGTGWAGPAAIRIEGGSFGLQIGGSATDVILLVMNDRGIDHLLGDKFTLGADAAVAAGPVGRQAQASTDVTLNAEMLAWSRSKGLFAGIALNGSTLRDDGSENKDLYGREISNRDIIKGDVPTPAPAKKLIKALERF